MKHTCILISSSKCIFFILCLKTFYFMNTCCFLNNLPMTFGIIFSLRWEKAGSRGFSEIGVLLTLNMLLTTQGYTYSKIETKNVVKNIYLDSHAPASCS